MLITEMNRYACRLVSIELWQVKTVHNPREDEEKPIEEKCLDWMYDCVQWALFFFALLYLWDTLAEGQTLLISKPQQRDRKPHMPQFKVRQHQSSRVTAQMSLTCTEVSSRRAVCPLYHERAAIFECDNMTQLQPPNRRAPERLSCEFWRKKRKMFTFC